MLEKRHTSNMNILQDYAVLVKQENNIGNWML